MNLGALNGFSINGSALDLNVRSSVIGCAYAIAAPLQKIKARHVFEAFADGEVTANYILDGAKHLIADAEAYAVSDVTSRSFRRNIETRFAYADASPLLTDFARSAVVAYALANASPNPTSYARRLVNSPVYGSASASAAYSGRLLTRLPIVGYANANSSVVTRIRARSVLSGTAEAIGFIGYHTTIWAPFDEPAMPENSFIVPYENHVFYVR